MLQGLGIYTRWEVIEGDEPFFETTKAFHNGLRGTRLPSLPISGTITARSIKSTANGLT